MIIENEKYCMLISHLRKDSMVVQVGNDVQKGEKLSQIGHNGSSQKPHLHIQIMDNKDLSKAQGISMSFDLEIYNGKKWEKNNNSIPKIGKKIRNIGE